MTTYIHLLLPTTNDFILFKSGIHPTSFSRQETPTPFSPYLYRFGTTLCPPRRVSFLTSAHPLATSLCTHMPVS